VNVDALTALLIVRIGDERFALDVGVVEEATDARGIERVPQLPPGAIGLLRWRGAAHTVWSPEPVLRVAPTAPSTVLFLRTGAGRVAMAVDDAEDLITLPVGRVQRMPGIEDGAGLVLGGIHVGNSIATVVDAAVLAASLSSRDSAAAGSEA
jgi:chemotaxis signal transduction protein